ncbi:2-hydroxypenta-2,4-dienoate hydratase [Candidatus Moduliflexus flocculans]|uniref:2-hydroxypenta-2,4-dienoate hydratase n=1 Tax=Candidatus Moduliflexus flocculans TaxID=1499966 RepID=A0A0S6W5Y5_9BACT|nr:2-hydroxypenta-2,4-dienoate hydratase [Candidatus Moduliflexus flocculans]
MNMLKRILTATVVTSLLLVSLVFAQAVDPAALLFDAYANKQPIPVLSATMPNLDVKAAYEIQKTYLQKRLETDKIGGFKAGLTTPAAQERFGVTAPVTGILFASGKLADGASVEAAAFRGLMLETEIGFVLGEAITQPVKDVAELQQKVRGVFPAIELPEMGFADMKQLKGVDIIAADVAAVQFIVGAEQALAGQDVNAVTVNLTLNGETVNTGTGKEALGDQWQAALWLVNSIIAQGWTIEPGHVLMTGALGKMIPGKPGKYTADYGDFGKITFEVK